MIIPPFLVAVLDIGIGWHHILWGISKGIV